MSFADYDRARADAAADAQDDSHLLRDYKLVRCHWASNDPNDGDPELTEFWAFHDGDDSEVPSCVFVASSWGGGCSVSDYDESRATEVGRIDGLYPSEVQAAMRKLIETI